MWRGHKQLWKKTGYKEKQSNGLVARGEYGVTGKKNLRQDRAECT